MKWRNTKERELFTSTNSINNEKNDSCEIITYSSPVNEINNSHTDENIHSRRE
jgi:hypothetical protein